jgi:hypothetical protein
MADLNAIVGSWKLVSITLDFVDTGEVLDLYGPDPKGVASISANGRVVFLLMRGDRQSDAAQSTLFETMGAYAGRCKLEGDVFTTGVDLAWEPSSEGSLRPRFVELEGDRATFRTGEQRDQPNYPGRPTVGRMVWEREV